jgi:hypothetical protein
MGRLLGLFLAGMPATPETTCALDATMADWRHEASRADTGLTRLRVAMTGVLSVARVLVVRGLKELPGSWSAPLLWRTAALSCLVLLWAIWYNPPLRFLDVLTTRELIVLAIVRAAPACVMLLPLTTFVSEAVFARTRMSPSFGALTVMTLVAAFAVLSIPELRHYERYVTWEHFANAATPPPVPFLSVFRPLGGETSALQTAVLWISMVMGCVGLTAATTSLSVLAYQVRRRSTIWGWVLGLTPFVFLFVVTWGLIWFLVRVFGAGSVVTHALYPPTASLLSLLSVTVLPLALAGLLARQTNRRESAQGSAVTA